MASEDEIASMLMRVAQDEEAAEDEQPKRRYRSRNAPQAPSQVYSIRLPREALGELRKLADERNEAPTGMIRRWVLERLQQERTAPHERAETVRSISSKAREARRRKLLESMAASRLHYSYVRVEQVPSPQAPPVERVTQHLTIERVAV